jgi:hypothetical protein
MGARGASQPKTAVSGPGQGFALGGSAQLDGDVLRLTGLEGGQQGTAFYPLWSHSSSSSEEVTVRFEMYVGDGTGADGMCVNIGGNSMFSRTLGRERYGENGVPQGVALCFDEYSNTGDHGVASRGRR